MLNKTRSRRAAAFMALLTLVWSLSGCMTLRPLDHIDGQYLVEKIKEGDEIGVTTKDNKYYEIEVSSISKETITGENISIAVNDISEVKVNELDGRKVFLITVAVLAGIAIVVHGLKKLSDDFFDSLF